MASIGDVFDLLVELHDEDVDLLSDGQQRKDKTVSNTEW